jgi:hypothetical protein
VVGVEELAAIVAGVEAEVAVVMEEGVVLRRGSLVLAPSEEKSTVVLVPPFGTSFTPTMLLHRSVYQQNSKEKENY